MALQENKYLTLRLSDEVYAIPILKIKEIIGMMQITEVPKLEKYFKGVINLRGQIIPIIDLRLKLELDEQPYDERTSIIVVEITTKEDVRKSGIVVDSVQEVLDIPPNDIGDNPCYGTSYYNSFLSGIGKVGEEVVMILDVDRILTSEEKNQLEMIDKETEQKI